MPETNPRLLVETELRAFSHQLDVTLGEFDLSNAVVRRLETAAARARPREHARRRRLVIALVAGVVAISTLAIPPVRAAVTNFFDVGAVRVHEEPPLGARTTSDALLLGEQTSLDAARTRMGVVVPEARGFESPDEVWFDARSGGVTSLVYRARPGLPAAEHTDDIGLLIQEFTGDGSTAVHKYLTGSARAQAVMVGSSEGVFLSGGDHLLFYEDPTGADVSASRRLVGNALIFQRGELTIRVEGNLPAERMVAIAASLR
jgi:hypothetical protein